MGLQLSCSAKACLCLKTKVACYELCGCNKACENNWAGDDNDVIEVSIWWEQYWHKWWELKQIIISCI